MDRSTANSEDAFVHSLLILSKWYTPNMTCHIAHKQMHLKKAVNALLKHDDRNGKPYTRSVWKVSSHFEFSRTGRVALMYISSLHCFSLFPVAFT